MASITPSVCSATATAFPPGVFITAMPLRVAASRSMLSTPTPARPITRSFCACSSSSASACTPTHDQRIRRFQMLGQFAIQLVGGQNSPARLLQLRHS